MIQRLLLITVLTLYAPPKASSCGPEEDIVGFNQLEFVQNQKSVHHRIYKREASINDRKACQPGDEAPKTRVDTTNRLEALRTRLKELNLDAFLVPSGDSHQSEYVGLADKRRQWIGGFTGSSGFAVITQDKAAMWTDGRYYLQAEDQLDCNWLFMKGQEDDEASWLHWLSKQLSPGGKIGADPTLTGALTWLEWKRFFDNQEKDLTMEETIVNPIDEVWIDQPSRPTDELEIHDVEYAGLTWQEKVTNLRQELEKHDKVDAIVITALDEIAWLFNLRGNDIPYTPVFRAYAIVDLNSDVILYLPPEKQTSTVKQHLKQVQIKDYEDIFEELPKLQENWRKVLLGKKVAYSGGASFAIYGRIEEKRRYFALSPVMLMKAQKNEVEIRGMKRANVRDAVALIEFAELLEDEMKNGKAWDELKAAKKLKELRQQQLLNKGLSFPSISAFGQNGAVIHYKPTNVTNTAIGKDAFFLLDSGGQYLDGTTDVTRTFHYGTPSDFEIEVYTRVLMGAIDLARATFLDGTPDTRLDILARWNLYQVGLNYRHGTGHGIGAYGFIHESPIQVRVYAKEEHAMREGYFFSDEPGYYEPGVGGVRLETVLHTVKKTLPYQDKNYGQFLGFEPVCLVPFEPHLIDYNLLNEVQINWLNYYNGLIKQHVGAELKKQGKTRALKWMLARTETITKDDLRQPRSANSSGNLCISWILACLGSLLVWKLK